MTRGKLILLMGPTGSGKSVLMEHVRATFPDISYLRTYTTRPRRSALENADYAFIDQPAFDAMAEGGELIEYAHLEKGSYGTPKKDVEDGLAAGRLIIKEMEVQGIRQVLAKLPREDVKIVYVDAGSWEEHERRVRARAEISEDELAKRKERHDNELPFKPQADVVVENLPGKLEEAKEALTAALLSIREGKI